MTIDELRTVGCVEVLHGSGFPKRIEIFTAFLCVPAAISQRRLRAHLAGADQVIRSIIWTRSGYAYEPHSYRPSGRGASDPGHCATSAPSLASRSSQHVGTADVVADSANRHGRQQCNADRHERRGARGSSLCNRPRHLPGRRLLSVKPARRPSARRLALMPKRQRAAPTPAICRVIDAL